MQRWKVARVGADVRRSDLPVLPAVHKTSLENECVERLLEASTTVCMYNKKTSARADTLPTVTVDFTYIILFALAIGFQCPL